LAVVVLVLTALDVYDRPAHPLDEVRYGGVWLSAVDRVLGDHPGGPCATDSFGVPTLPGVGNVTTQCFSGWRRGAVQIIFHSGASTGLVYNVGYPLPFDMCVASLGGPWYQLAPVNVISCPRGFDFAPGP